MRRSRTCSWTWPSLEGTVQTALLSARAPSFTVAVNPSPLQVFKTYVQLGVEHILTGVDHLLFVLCLILLVRSIRKLLATVTAFTVAHSITLAAATLGLVNVPAAPVEATIALSIVFLASELLRAPTRRSAITQTYPWLVAFSFGLLHGLGFAGALAEIGLPHGEIPLALFSFNVGVELGQLAFIAAVLLLNHVARRLVQSSPIGPHAPPPTPLAAPPPTGSSSASLLRPNVKQEGDSRAVCTSAPGHSLQGRPSGKSGHVRCDTDSGPNSASKRNDAKCQKRS